MSVFLTKQKIKKEWTDYNSHMNVAYYLSGVINNCPKIRHIELRNVHHISGKTQRAKIAIPPLLFQMFY